MLVPKLRFSEFTDEWKPTILYDMFDTITDFVAAGSFADLAENVKYNNNKDYAQLIRTIDIKNKFKNKDFVYINEKAYDFLWRVNLDKDAVILPNIGANIGERYFIDSKKLPYLKSALGPNAILLRSSINNQKYLYNLFNTRTFEIQLKNIVGASGQPKFNKTELKKFIFNICSISEQNKIADFIALLDKKIELQSQKIEALKLYKKGLNFTIFNDKENITNYSLNNLIEEYNVKTSKNNQYSVLSSTLNGIFMQENYFNKQASSSDTTNYKIIPRNYITYRSMSDTGEFHFNEQTILDYGIVSPAYPVFKFSNKVNQGYVVNYMNENNSFKNKLLCAKEGGTRYALGIKKLQQLDINVPSKEKQEFYYNCIMAILTKLKKENQKLLKLQQLKKGLMQSMFV